MTRDEIMTYLASKGSEQVVRIFRNHGCEGELFGVKVGDLKPIQKKVKVNHALAEELFQTSNSDAQYLAGLIADPKAFSNEQFENWVDKSTWYMITDYAIAWNLAESPLCWDISLKWIKSADGKRQTAAWSALAAHLGIANNEILNFTILDDLLQLIEKTIFEVSDRTRYCMNGFIIALGGAVPEFTQKCIELGKRLGYLKVYMGNTSCKVPFSPDYISKMIEKGRIGKKKKTAKC